MTEKDETVEGGFGGCLLVMIVAGGGLTSGISEYVREPSDIPNKFLVFLVSVGIMAFYWYVVYEIVVRVVTHPIGAATTSAVLLLLYVVWRIATSISG